jgi:hypothetical protein
LGALCQIRLGYWLSNSLNMKSMKEHEGHELKNFISPVTSPMLEWHLRPNFSSDATDWADERATPSRG